ncbi:MAG: hypothetical protein ORN51_02475 [Akkermansiaceae bacterium]|nr:hypothetical protein [Akkermansiaceae bacterium]
MNHSEFSDRHFATRERLSEVIRGIAALSEETGTVLEHLLSGAGERMDLESPCLMVVAGEANADTPCFIHGLVGQDLCLGNTSQKPARLHWYRHGREIHNDTRSSNLEICERPVDFLRRFSLVDVPSAQVGSQIQLDATTRLLPCADLIFMVFPAANPWGAATWNAIATFPPETLEKTVLVLQQSNPCESSDLKVITGHVADLAMKRIGRVLPLFVVSGKLASEAKRTIPLAVEPYQASGYFELERFIGQRICESQDRQQTLKTWYERAASATRLVDDQIESQSRALSNHGRFLDTIEREIDDIREDFIARLPLHLAGVAEVFQLETIGIAKVLRRRLGVIPTIYRLFAGDRTGVVIESLLIERLQAAVDVVAENDGAEVVLHCRRHRQALDARVRETMGIDLKNADPLDEVLDTSKIHFKQHLAGAARHGVHDLRVRRELEKQIRRRNSELQSFVIAVLISTAAGGITGALGVAWLPFACCGLAAVLGLVCIVKAYGTRRAIEREFQSRLFDACDEFATMLRSDYSEALRRVCQDYASSLSEVRSHLFREKHALAPRLKRWKELFLTLKAVEQDL